MDRLDLFNNLMIMAAADGKFTEEEIAFQQTADRIAERPFDVDHHDRDRIVAARRRPDGSAVGTKSGYPLAVRHIHENIEEPAGHDQRVRRLRAGAGQQSGEGQDD